MKIHGLDLPRKDSGIAGKEMQNRYWPKVIVGGHDTFCAQSSHHGQVHRVTGKKGIVIHIGQSGGQIVPLGAHKLDARVTRQTVYQST